MTALTHPEFVFVHSYSSKGKQKVHKQTSFAFQAEKVLVCSLHITIRNSGTKVRLYEMIANFVIVRHHNH